MTGPRDGHIKWSESEEDKDHIYWWNLKIRHRWTYLQNLKQTHTNRKETYDYQKGKGWREKFGITVYTALNMLLLLLLSRVSPVWLCATPWTVAHQAPQSMGFPRQEYWSSLPLPSPPLYIKVINHKVPLYSTGIYIQYLEITYNGK